MAYNALVIQDLTYTQLGYTGVALKVSYVNGSALAVNSYDPATGILQVTIVSGSSTATEIAAAVNASTVANQFVIVTVTGTGGTAQKTCNAAALSGGAVAAKATLAVGAMLLTAKSTGTSGNSTTFKFTSGAVAGSEVVTVSTAAITCQISEGVSTYQQVLTAIAAAGPADALVDGSSSGCSLGAVARVSHCAAFTALAGGATAVGSSVTVQNIKITSLTLNTTHDGKTLSYTTGATAGSEVVTVSSANVSVQIENGVSTATQIKAALDAAGAFTALYAATIPSGGSTAQVTVNQAPLAGATAVNRGVSKDGTSMALTSSFVAVRIPFSPSNLRLINDETSGAKGVVYSFDGTNSHGTLLFGQSLSLDWLESVSVIYLKYVSAAPAYRLSVTPN